jgi:OPT family oligopeptide transporter
VGKVCKIEKPFNKLRRPSWSRWSNAQLVGTLVASSVYFGTSWWLLETVNDICDKNKLPEGSPWACPADSVFFNASIIWGVVGPLRMFGHLGRYAKMYCFFLIGALAPVPFWALSRTFPATAPWVRLVNMPVLLGATASMPPARSVNYLMWGAVELLFNYVVYRRYKGWWARHNYVLSAGLDAGVAFMGIVSYAVLQSQCIDGVNWWG